MNKTKLLLVILILLPCLSFAATKDDIGTSTMPFLKIGAGPRALAMGEAYTAVADDATSLYWNPAGLARLKNIQIVTGHDTLLESISFIHLLIGLPISTNYTIGIGITHLKQPGLTKYDEFGNKQGTITPQDTAALLSLAGHWGNLYGGITAKFISSRYGTSSARAGAGDVGIIYSMKNVDIGFAGQHIGKEVTFEKESFPLPTMFRTGIAAYFFDNRNLIISSDLLVPNDNQLIYTAGAEASFNLRRNRRGLIRIGYNSRADDIDGILGVSAGVGLAYRQFTFHYTWIPYGDLGTSFRMGLSYDFGQEFEPDDEAGYYRKRSKKYKAKKGRKGKKEKKPKGERKFSLEE